MDFMNNELWQQGNPWETLESMQKKARLDFTIGNIMQYFIHRKALDGKPTSDFKDFNSKAFPLFRAGHVQCVLGQVVMSNDSSILQMKASCAAEMKTKVLYKIKVAIALNTNDIVFAVCGCPAGCGPTATCKHIGALCYYIEEFCRLSNNNTTTGSQRTANPVATSLPVCTSTLQQWHQPSRKRYSVSYKMDTIKFVKAEYGKAKRLISSNYDPRPIHQQRTREHEIAQLQRTLSSIDTPIAMLHVLPNAEVVSMTASSNTCTNAIVLPPIPRSSQTKVQYALNREPQPFSLTVLYQFGLRFLELITHNTDDISKIEVATHRQSQCPRWFEERYCRITASNVGTLCKGAITTAKVQSVLSSGKTNRKDSCGAILWGQQHENDAYLKYDEMLDSSLRVRKAGIYIYQTNGFLAASPDGIVTSAADDSVQGVIEIKCPYSCRNMTVREACHQVKSFYCEIVNDNIRLKRSHAYFYQIQTSMAVTGVQWCDFIVWTVNDFSVERIPFNESFWKGTIGYLQSIYLNFILPEIINPRIKFGLDVIPYDFPTSSTLLNLSHLAHEH